MRHELETVQDTCFNQFCFIKNYTYSNKFLLHIGNVAQCAPIEGCQINSIHTKNILLYTILNKLFYIQMKFSYALEMLHNVRKQ